MTKEKRNKSPGHHHNARKHIKQTSKIRFTDLHKDNVYLHITYNRMLADENPSSLLVAVN